MSQRSQFDAFIPESLGKDDVLLEKAPIVGTVQFVDGFYIVVPSIIAFMIFSYLIPLGSYGIVVFLMMVGFSSVLLMVKPQYLSLHQWLKVKYGFRKRENQKKKHPVTDGGEPIDEYEKISDDDTRSLTEIDKIYPYNSCVETKDGDIVSVIEFSGTNIDLSDQSMKISVLEQYTSSISSSLEDDIQFYLPMRPVNLKSIKDQYRTQYENKNYDVNNEEFMEQYVQDRIDWLDQQSKNRYIRETYVVVSVTDSEVFRRNRVGSGGYSGLENIPGGEVLADVLAVITSDEELSSDKERTRQKLRTLEKKRDNIGAMLSAGGDNTYRVLDSSEQISILKEFWSGEKIPDDQMDGLISKKPAMTAEVSNNDQ